MQIFGRVATDRDRYLCFGGTENDYRMALDRESYSQKEVTVSVPHSQKFPLLMSL